MAIYRIPLPQGVPQFTQQTLIDGVTFNIRIHWNEREEAWYFDLLDDENAPIVTGRKMVADWPLLHRSVDARLPAGQFFTIDLTGNGIDPGLNDLDDRVVLQYFDAESMAAL